MDEIIDFMTPVDENTPADVVFKMLRAAQYDKLVSLEREALSSNKEALLINENLFLKCTLYGNSSEKKVRPKDKPPEPDPQIFDEAKASADDLINDEALVVNTDEADAKLNAAADLIDIKKPSKNAKPKGRKPIPGGYPRIDVIHDLDEAQKTCACGCQMHSFGADISEQLQVIPAKIAVIRHNRLKYGCKNCQIGVKTAPVSNQAIAKCLAAPGLLAHVAVAKFDDHLPLYRQSEIWGRLGIDLPRSTLSAWVLKMGSALAPLVSHMQKHINKSDYVQADETQTQVHKTPNKKDTSQSYMWVYKTGNHPNPAAVYEYQETRKGDFAATFLKGFQGVLQTDGYSGYHCVTSQEGITAAGCFAHARRKFYEVWRLEKKEGVASKALDIIGKLYEIEDEIKELPIDQKLHIRQTKSKISLHAFHIWLTEIKPKIPPKSGLYKAVQYALNQWPSLIYYLTDGAVAIDNNAAERQIKPFAVGRKNWLFMGSPDGARAAATLYSLIESAKLNSVNPEGYLKFVLEHKIDDLDEADLERLMPWNVEIDAGYEKPVHPDEVGVDFKDVCAD
jgi:transposase